MPVVRLRLLTNSELKTLRRCAREHFIAYKLGMRSAAPEAEALYMGTLLHLGFAAWWLGDPQTRLADALDVMLPRARDDFDRARVFALLTGYDARWCDERWETLSVEVEFRAPLVNPETNAPSRTFDLGGKIDVIARNLDDGLTYVVEHKSTSEDISAGSQYWELLQLDAQVSTYYAGARALGHEPVGVLYDVIAKPKIRPLEATPVESRKYLKKTGELYANQREYDESPQEFEQRLLEAVAAEPDRWFRRGVVVRLITEERESEFDRWQLARVLREGDLAKRWPRNPDACKRWGRVCDYFGVCTGRESLDDPALFRHTDQVHEELSTQLTATNNTEDTCER